MRLFLGASSWVVYSLLVCPALDPSFVPYTKALVGRWGALLDSAPPTIKLARWSGLKYVMRMRVISEVPCYYLPRSLSYNLRREGSVRGCLIRVGTGTVSYVVMLLG
ncbi:hypothetical protein BHM03_00020997 [Ensete ventricosum]|uniref:Secreted protein n=1 Tax=Ensete ventricosum TaxID=4639 RepID=A0A445MFX5_ENSVE|nr:hypothetical protein BHM03_00020997 [Ensete ventricosum]